MEAWIVRSIRLFFAPNSPQQSPKLASCNAQVSNMRLCRQTCIGLGTWQFVVCGDTDAGVSIHSCHRREFDLGKARKYICICELQRVPNAEHC